MRNPAYVAAQRVYAAGLRARYSRTGIYPIVLTVTDELGASDTATTTVTVR